MVYLFRLVDLEIILVVLAGACAGEPIDLRGIIVVQSPCAGRGILPGFASFGTFFFCAVGQCVLILKFQLPMSKNSYGVKNGIESFHICSLCSTV